MQEKVYVKLTPSAAVGRIPEMKPWIGEVINGYVPNNRWLIVKWPDRTNLDDYHNTKLTRTERIWTELKTNLKFVTKEGHRT